MPPFRLGSFKHRLSHELKNLDLLGSHNTSSDFRTGGMESLVSVSRVEEQD